MIELPKTGWTGGREAAGGDVPEVVSEVARINGVRRGRARACGLWWLMGLLSFANPTDASSPVEFYLIERFLALGVLIHFDVEPLRSYELQSTTNFAAASGQATAPTNAWKTVYRVDPSPFSNHYILPEFFTNSVSQQFYRLVATP